MVVNMQIPLDNSTGIWNNNWTTSGTITFGCKERGSDISKYVNNFRSLVISQNTSQSWILQIIPGFVLNFSNISGSGVAQ